METEGEDEYDYEGEGLKEDAIRVYRRAKLATKAKTDKVSKVLKSVIHGIDSFTPSTQKTLNKYGDRRIKKITLGRYPIESQSLLEKSLKAANIFNPESWNKSGEQLLNEIGYDKLFHLYSILELEGVDEPIVFEKQTNVNVVPETVSSLTKDEIGKQRGLHEKLDVPLQGKDITLGELTNKTREKMGDEKFFKYDSFQDNCQQMLSQALSSVGLQTPETKAFIYQNLKKLQESLPWWAKFISDLSTEAEARATRVQEGGAPPLPPIPNFLVVTSIFAFLEQVRRVRPSTSIDSLISEGSVLKRKMNNITQGEVYEFADKARQFIVPSINALNPIDRGMWDYIERIVLTKSGGSPDPRDYQFDVDDVENLLNEIGNLGHEMILSGNGTMGLNVILDKAYKLLTELSFNNKRVRDVVILDLIDSLAKEGMQDWALNGTQEQKNMWKWIKDNFHAMSFSGEGTGTKKIEGTQQPQYPKIFNDPWIHIGTSLPKELIGSGVKPILKF